MRNLTDFTKKNWEKTTLKRSIEFRRPRVDERRTLTLLEPASKQSGRKSSCWMATTLRGNSTTCSRDRECSDHTCRNLDRPPPTNSLPSLQLTHDYCCCSIQHQHWRFLGLSITVHHSTFHRNWQFPGVSVQYTSIPDLSSAEQAFWNILLYFSLGYWI